MKKHNIGFISLGCAKNLVDSEIEMDCLIRNGCGITGDPEKADLLIVNTCGFLNSAIEESVGTINEFISKGKKVLVTGCLGKRADYVRRSCPGIVGVAGPQDYNEVLQQALGFLNSSGSASDSGIKLYTESLIPESSLTPPHYSYLKISEGCSNHCSYCVIPELRGPMVSRKADNILREAARKTEKGVREILIIAQDTAAYGKDLGNSDCTLDDGRSVRQDIVSLCEELGKLNIWIRLHYLYPYPVLDRLVELMSDRVILPYLDVPMQHASPRILKSMKRPGTVKKTLDRISKWRKTCPDITIRSTFIVGYPGETESDFEILLDFIKEAKLDRVGCFAYSDTPGALANSMPQLPDEVKEERLDRFMTLQQEISKNNLSAKVGRVLPVIVDGTDSMGRLYGRTMGDSPDIDGLVYILTDAEHRPGEIVSVRITDSDEYDLFGSESSD